MGRISIAATLGWVVAFALGLAALVNATEFWAGATLFLTLAALLGSVLGMILRGWRGGGWLGFAVFGWGYLFFQIFMLWVGLSREMWTMSEPVSAWVFEKANPQPTLPASMIPQPPPQIPPPPSSPTYEAPPPTSPPVPISQPPDLGVSPPLEGNASPSAPDPRAGILDGRPSMPPDPNAEFIAAMDRQAERLEKAKEIGHWLVVLAFAGLGSIFGIVLVRGRPAGVGAAPAA